jgi:hypothetical protein
MGGVRRRMACGFGARALNRDGSRRRTESVNNPGGTLVKNIHLLAAVAVLVATSAAIASAAEATSEGPAPFAVPGTHYDLVDAQGNVVGELVNESATRVKLRVIGVTNVQHAAPQRTVSRRADSTFHPDYSTALTPGQMSAAWQAELDRLFPQPVTGGG